MGSARRWPAGSRLAIPGSTSDRTGRGGSPTRTATRPSRPAWARETYSDYYRLRYPHDADLAGRPRRLSPLHGRLQEAGAVFGTKAGWERADHHEPGRPWRRVGPGPGRATAGRAAMVRPRRATRVGRSASGPGIIDLSSFGKIDVDGPGALALLQRVAANDVDRPVGQRRLHPVVRRAGGMVADVTVTRLAEDRFRVVTGAGFVASDLAWLRWTCVGDPTGRGRRLRDVSDGLATIGLWGPRARDILAAASRDDVGDAALPARRAREIGRGSAAPGPGGPDQLRRRARLGADDAQRTGPSRSGMRYAPPARTTASSRSATAPSTPCGWRRATATSART